jgi:two-component system response regulator AtoC
VLPPVPNGKILVVDDEPAVRDNLAEALAERGHTVSAAASAEEARRHVNRSRPDLLLLDRKLPDGDGVELLAELRRSGLHSPAIIITAHGTIANAVEALRQSAYDYVAKPFALEEVLDKVERALSGARRMDDNAFLRRALRKRFRFDTVLSLNPTVQECYLLATRAAPTDVTVLIEGATGTGKEFLARWIHYLSPRADAPFVTINCAALPEPLIESELFGHEKGAYTSAGAAKPGLLEVADGGTVLLDEVGDMPLSTQAKLLRFLQERTFQRLGSTQTTTVDVRVLAATNKDLLQQVHRRAFRDDLYYRLSVLTLYLPPLRERPEDTPLWAEHFLRKHAARVHKEPPVLTAEALRVLQTHTWPGNIRELENCIQRAVLLTDNSTIGPSDLHIQRPLHSPLLSLAEAERQHIQAALRAANSSVSKAADILQIDPRTLRSKMRKHGIGLSD